MTKEEIHELHAKIANLENTLDFYANPENYHAIAFFPDNPAGAFMDDFSNDHDDPFYDRAMPGKLARATLRGEYYDYTRTDSEDQD